MKKPVRIPPTRLVFLEYLIAKSRDACPLAKKTAIWLLRQSNGLTRAISVNFKAGKDAEKALNGFHNMASSIHSTHLNEVMHAMGTTFRFSHRTNYGLGTAAVGANVWLAGEYYDPGAKMLRLNLSRIKAVDLNIKT